MQNGLHFISGLPRSGSTLLAAILRQNPNFHAGMSSPVGPLFTQLMNAMGAGAELSIFIEEEQRLDVLRGIFTGYYKNLHREKAVFDTNRLWCSRMSALSVLYPGAKIVACVRDPIWVIDSFERMVRKNPLVISRMFPGEANATVFTRVDHLTGKLGTVGFAFNALQEAFFSEQAKNLIVIDYETLSREPKNTIERLYEFLEVPRFTHDFDNVTYDGGDEFDHWLGVPGLHTISRKVEFKQRETVLPPEIVQRFANQCFWRHREANRSGVTVLAPPPRRVQQGNA